MGMIMVVQNTTPLKRRLVTHKGQNTTDLIVLLYIRAEEIYRVIPLPVIISIFWGVNPT